MKRELQSFRCPRWDELPNIPLYVDQLVMVIHSALEPLADSGEPIVTKAMINNYVKQNILLPPEQKKYDRNHIAMLMVISLLKRVFSMTEIVELIHIMAETCGVEQAYNAFCESLEHKVTEAFSESAPLLELHPANSPAGHILDTALTAFVGKLVIQSILAGHAARDAGQTDT